MVFRTPIGLVNDRHEDADVGTHADASLIMLLEIAHTLKRIEARLPNKKNPEYYKNPSLVEVYDTLLEALADHPNGLNRHQVMQLLADRGKPLMSINPSKLMATHLSRITGMYGSKIIRRKDRYVLTPEALSDKTTKLAKAP